MRPWGSAVKFAEVSAGGCGRRSVEGKWAGGVKSGKKKTKATDSGCSCRKGSLRGASSWAKAIRVTHRNMKDAHDGENTKNLSNKQPHIVAKWVKFA